MADTITIIILSQRSCHAKAKIKFSAYLIKHHDMKMYGKLMYRSTYSEPGHYMVASGQLQASAAL
jgi:hypothetical protein